MDFQVFSRLCFPVPPSSTQHKHSPGMAEASSPTLPTDVAELQQLLLVERRKATSLMHEVKTLKEERAHRVRRTGGPRSRGALATASLALAPSLSHRPDPLASLRRSKRWRRKRK